MISRQQHLLAVIYLLASMSSGWHTCRAFQAIQPTLWLQRPCQHHHSTRSWRSLAMLDDAPNASPADDGVVELATATRTTTTSTGDDNSSQVISTAISTAEKASTPPTAPFLSQRNDLDPEALNPDLSDPKQARVIIYILISLIPVLFLIPLMIASRDFIPADMLPPVEM